MYSCLCKKLFVFKQSERNNGYDRFNCFQMEIKVSFNYVFIKNENNWLINNENNRLLSNKNKWSISNENNDLLKMRRLAKV